jgi:alpha-amylase/alpha-mannosidase (GH57 family)
MSAKNHPGKDSNKLNVVLFWHMHQPEYRNLRDGVFHQPWTYLHVIKDYVDMAAHLEENPQARAVVNFVPVLLEQIDDYRHQLNDYIHHAGNIRDPLLAALADAVVPHEHERRLKLIKDCTRANEERLIKRFPAYQTLVEMAQDIIASPEILDYYGEQYLFDLLVWYHLVWMGETVRRSDQRIKSLINKKRLYSFHDRQILIEVIFELVTDVIGRYRKLAQQGRIELSMTPYAHPITPLLIDFNSASEAMPDVSLPLAHAYPDGTARSNWHITHGIEVFEHHFGIKPSGCWPAEGSVSTATVKELSDANFDWLATGETVLRNSLEASGLKQNNCIHNSYKLDGNKISCFFRDDGISDMIGFKYQNWHADDAVANLVESLTHIASACHDHPEPIVSIILDGENAWEHYPKNGYYFLSGLYKKLSEHKQINLTTFNDYIKHQTKPQLLNKMVAGSWVYGTFSTWIGEKDKNRAWDMLVDAKRVYDEVILKDELNDQEKQRAQMQLATCESSDWFWWFGDYNPSDSVKAFDEQYRLHLSNLYHYLHREPPQYLSHSFSTGNMESTSSGVMLPGKQG